MRRTIDYVKSFSAAQLDGAAARNIVIPMRNAEALNLDGETYLKHFALPNFFFHCTTTYLLLRHNGVDVGKGDFLGR